MLIISRTVGDVLVFDIEGAYTREAPPNPTLRELVKAKLETGANKILFNLGKAEIASDVGVSDILACHVSISNVQGKIKLAGVSRKTMRLFMIACLDKLFDIYPTEKEALESFGKA